MLSNLFSLTVFSCTRYGYRTHLHSRACKAKDNSNITTYIESIRMPFKTRVQSLNLIASESQEIYSFLTFQYDVGNIIFLLTIKKYIIPDYICKNFSTFLKPKRALIVTNHTDMCTSGTNLLLLCHNDMYNYSILGLSFRPHVEI